MYDTQEFFVVAIIISKKLGGFSCTKRECYQFMVIGDRETEDMVNYHYV